MYSYPLDNNGNRLAWQHLDDGTESDTNNDKGSDNENDDDDDDVTVDRSFIDCERLLYDTIASCSKCWCTN